MAFLPCVSDFFLLFKSTSAPALASYSSLFYLVVAILLLGLLFSSVLSSIWLGWLFLARSNLHGEWQNIEW